MNIVFHQGLTEEHWNTLSLMEQMGNIGSEFNRSISWRARGNTEQAEATLYRGLELFDLTVADPANHTRLHEVCRSREAFLIFLSEKTNTIRRRINGRNTFSTLPLLPVGGSE